MTARAATLALLSLALACCRDRDAPRPVSDLGSPAPATDELRPLSSRETAPAPPAAGATLDPNDPAEPGIPDLARLARYVFRTMQRHDDVCPSDNPFSDRLHFALAIEVARGRMLRVALAHVSLEPATGAPRPLAKAQWPDTLAAHVACLEPHLKALVMAPAPADGAYEPAYSLGGNPAGRSAP